MENTSRPCAVLAIAFCIGLSAPTTFAAPGDIHNLGVLPGHDISVGAGINASGQVVGTSYLTGYSGARAFRYDGVPGSGGVMHDLGTLGRSQSRGNGINDAGQVVGTAYNTSDSQGTAFRYDGTPGSSGVMRDLGLLNGLPTRAYGINSSAQVAGIAYDPSYSGSRAFRYDGTPGAGGVMHDFGIYTSALGINDAGQVAGSAWFNPQESWHAARFDGIPGAGGVVHDLGTLYDFSYNNGRAINNSGQVVGSADAAGGTDFPPRRAFRYDGTPGAGGVLSELEHHPGLMVTIVYALDINELGFAVGRDSRIIFFGGLPSPYAALWRPDRSVIDLNAWLHSVNPTSSGWYLREATGINEFGLIVGQGVFRETPSSDPVTRAFILDASTLIPEPSSLAIALAVFAALVRRSPR